MANSVGLLNSPELEVERWDQWCRVTLKQRKVWKTPGSLCHWRGDVTCLWREEHRHPLDQEKLITALRILAR